MRAWHLATGLALLLPLAAAAQQQRGPAGLVDATCVAKPAEPCQGRIDFQRQRSFTVYIDATGQAEFVNTGNRRCRLDYSISNANSAAAGRSLELGPSASAEVPMTGPGQVQFTYGGMGSIACDLLIRVK